jgi:ABC-type transporter Mla MlaB component
MRNGGVPFPVRQGEHACAHSTDQADHLRLLAAFVTAGIERGHKVVCLCGDDECGAVLAHLCADGEIDAAVGRGQVEVREAAGAYTPEGSFDASAMIETLNDEHRQALAGGYDGLSMCGNVCAGLGGAAGDRVIDYERSVEDEVAGGSRVLLCCYDPGVFDQHTLAEVTSAHRVVVSPGLAAIGRTGVLAAARVTSPDTLRLAGQLDFEVAKDVAEILETEFPGPRRVDAADLDFVDVTGLRVLRGRQGERLNISAASESVRRLIALLGWDTDPAVQITA